LLAHIQQYQVVAMGLLENACPLQAGGGINLDAVTAQKVHPRVACYLFFVDEQNLSPVEGGAAAKWGWVVHGIFLKRVRPVWAVRTKSAPGRNGGQ
jgi:hypothetical protein